VSIPILFMLVATGVVGWWLFARQLTAKPWEREQRGADDQHDGATLAVVPPRVGLWVLLGVITSFFGLFMSAYSMRMMLSDWRPLAEPGVLWGNTLILILASLAFQWTRWAAERGDPATVKTGLLAAGFSTCAFIVGQLLAWRQLDASGQFMSGNAANAFFYLLTGLHGLHLLGGLMVWAKTTVRMWLGNSELGEIRLSVQLCTVYWHYLLLVWLVLFGLLLTT
jgi:cytochrome c oxidase subunit 3